MLTAVFLAVIKPNNPRCGWFAPPIALSSLALEILESVRGVIQIATQIIITVIIYGRYRA